MPKGYIIGHITVTDPDAYQEYIVKDTPILKRLGAKFIVRGGQSETPEGATQNRHVVIEFPSYAQALAAYASPEYRENMKIRLPAGHADLAIVEGYDG